MPVHDWTRVEAGIFHDFHVAWLPEIRKALNGGLLPEMPLSLNFERYVSLPLESTYAAAYQGMPAFWRDVLEGKRPPGE